MTTTELILYYCNLLIIQYRQKTKARATIAAWIEPLLMDQLPVQVENAFDINTAEGVQLDVLGKYVGVSRNGYTLSGPVTLDDSDYRQLIKMVIIKNNSGSSLATIQNLLAAAFPNQIFITDNQTMGLTYLLIESLGTNDLLEILATGGYLPAPMGVQVSTTILPPIEFPYFGFYDSNNPGAELSGFNSYEFYNQNTPWLGAT